MYVELQTLLTEYNAEVARELRVHLTLTLIIVPGT